MDHGKPTLKVTVFSDYICPFCYIGSRRLSRLDREFDLRVNWCGMEIHPETPPQGMSLARLGFAPAQITQMTEALAVLARQEDIDMPPRDFTTNSHQALLLAEAAKRAGRDTFYAVHEGLFRSYFSSGKNIGDRDVLRSVARDSGMPEDLVETAWSDAGLERRLLNNLELAAGMRIRSTPTFVIGEEIIIGAVPYERLQQAATYALGKA